MTSASCRDERTQATRSVQLAVGIAFAIIGAEILIIPARFARSALSPYAGLALGLPAWGIAFIGIGACLCAMDLLQMHRPATLFISMCAALLLGLLCALRVANQAWAEAALYGCTSLAILLASFLPADAARPWQAVRRSVGAGHAAVMRTIVGLALIGFGVARSATVHDWPTTALAVSLGLAVVLGPRLIPAQPLDVASLRVRLVILTVILTSGSLTLASLAISANAESTAIADAVADQQLTAAEITQSLVQADSDYRGLVTTLAARGGLAQLNTDQQRVMLQGLTATNVYAFATYDGDGQALARSDDRPLQPLPPQMLNDLQRSGAAVHGLGTVPGSTRPALMFAAPYFSSDATTAGYTSAELDLDQVSRALAMLASVGRTGTSVFVLGPDGNVLLHPPPNGVDAAATPPARQSSDTGGTLRYSANGREYVAALAQVPSLGWSVVSAFPISYALSGVQSGSEWAFGLLVLTVALSTVLSLVLANRVVAPLVVLGNAMDELAAESSDTPLPRSGVAEVQRLTTLFAAMRQRLVQRTAERQGALDSAREAIRVREEFMSIAAHELKTPVTATRGHAQLLLKRMRGGNHIEPNRLRDSLERIDTQTHKLARLIEQLLDVARLERGILSIQPRQFDLRQLVPEVLADRPEQHRFRVLLPSEPVPVNADLGRLEQVLSNVVENAAKFSPEDAAIDVELSLPALATARLTVRDHGVGIPPEHRERIFERFHQAHAESHRSGFGLGLYIAKQIVDLHGGTISIDCPTTGGTRVRIDLPTMSPGGQWRLDASQRGLA